MSEAERLAERLEHVLRMYELPRGACVDIREAATLIRAQSARIAALEEALRRIGSSEAIGTPFMMNDSHEAFELRERMEIARLALGASA